MPSNYCAKAILGISHFGPHNSSLDFVNCITKRTGWVINLTDSLPPFFGQERKGRFMKPKGNLSAGRYVCFFGEKKENGAAPWAWTG